MSRHVGHFCTRTCATEGIVETLIPVATSWNFDFPDHQSFDFIGPEKACGRQLEVVEEGRTEQEDRGCPRP